MSPSEPAQRLAQQLAALPHVDMRAAALVTYIGRVEIAEAVRTLDDFRRLGATGTAPYTVSLLALVRALAYGSIAYEMTVALYEDAKRQELESLCPMFFSGPPEETVNPTGTDRNSLELTLGHRKTQARGQRRDTLLKLLHKPEVPVVEILLENTHLTETDLIRLAARRPTDPRIQRMIFKSAKWIARYGVKRSLIFNPATPIDISVRLVHFLTISDLKYIEQSTPLPELLRAVAHLVAKERSA